MINRTELRALCERATEGPWDVTTRNSPWGGNKAYGTREITFILNRHKHPHLTDYMGITDEMGANAKLFQASRTAIPALLDRIDELERVMGVMAEKLRFIQNGCLVPPDGGSPRIEDYMQSATESLQEHAKLMEDTDNAE